MEATNNILMIVLTTGRKLTFSFPSGKPKDVFMKEAVELDGIKEEEIKKIYFIPAEDCAKGNITPTLASQGMNIVTGEINHLVEAKDTKLTEIRRYRDLLLKKLDIEFISTLEEDDCEECKKHIIKIKKYFRDIPKQFIDKKFISVEEIANFNVFDNIFDIYIIEPGTGYTSPPEISIDKPNNHPQYGGFPMEANAIVENGSVKEIVVTQIGSSYIHQPDVQISPPDEEGGKQAELTASIPENNIDMPSTLIENLKLNELI